MTDAIPRPPVLIVVPCLNEATHIGPLLTWLSGRAEHLNARIVVADGGSNDGTQDIVSAFFGAGHVELLDNPKRLQSAGINLAVETHAGDSIYLIRIDAHGAYPEDYCDQLLADAQSKDADSVVVAMLTRGEGIVQRAAATAQNSALGTGGSRHRKGSRGTWIDHGHHALMRIAAFRAVGGYDESFSHNEDAELDHRLRAAGYRIWLTGNTAMTYFPRTTFLELYRQYLGYGSGRARNVLKHRTIPKLRQMAPLLVAPAVALVPFALLTWLALVPLVSWALLCIGYGTYLGVRGGNMSLALSGVSAMVMHLAWSLGFWRELAVKTQPRSA